MTPQLLLSVADAAKALGVGRTKTWELIDTGQLEAVRIGRRALIPTEALEDFVARLRLEQAS